MSQLPIISGKDFIKFLQIIGFVVAATALENSLTLISRNAKDFKNISGLDIINPYEL